MKFVLLASASLLAATPAVAEEVAAPEDIVVLATGFEAPAGQTGQAISVVSRDRIDQLQSTTVSDVLRTLPSVTVAQRGPVGAQSSVFVRGGNSSQTLVLVDGVRVNDPSSPNAAFDFGPLIAGNVERVEVLRGPNSIIWGSQAIGGVVNIETRRPKGPLRLTAGVEGGSYDTVQAHANVSGQSGAAGYSFGGAFYRTDGFSIFSGGTERDGSREAQANGRVTLELAPGLQLDLRGNYSDARVDFDSRATNFLTGQSSGGANSLAQARNRQWFAYAGLNLDALGGRLRNRLAYTRADIHRVGTDPVANTFNNYDATGVTDSVEYRAAFDLAASVELAAGLVYEHIRSTTAYEGAAPDRASNDVTGGYAQLTLRPFTGLTATGGVRHDVYSDYGAHTTLGGNLAYTPNGGATILRATYAEGFRAPSLSEGQPPYGNLALKPETAQNIDVGIEQWLLDRRIGFNATWFHRRSTNLIVFSFATFQSENVGRADADGLELGLTVRPTDRLHVEAGYALVDAFNRSAPNAGKRLALRPQHTANFSVDWETPLGLSLGGSLQLVGDSFDDAANTVRLDGYALASLRASLPVTDRVELYGRIENLTDEKYQSVFGYNTPGRSAYAGVRVRY